MIENFYMFGQSTMIMGEYLMFKFQSYVLLLNTATKLSELSTKEYWYAAFHLSYEYDASLSYTTLKGHDLRLSQFVLKGLEISSLIN